MTSASPVNGIAAATGIEEGDKDTEIVRLKLSSPMEANRQAGCPCLSKVFRHRES
jgi:hypothetical protein